jgi:hypothetical protein
MKSLPAAAASGLPKTGAATYNWLAVRCASASRSDNATLIVLIETWIALFGRANRMPPLRNTTSSTARSSGNIPEAIDLEWFKQGGGFIRSKHPPAHRFNAGEKLVFWLALSAGAVVSASGYLLLFPFYATSITGMQIANVIHSVGAILFIALILGHIYIGTIGMEGAFEAMWTGEVDFNWAKEHHNLWLEEELAKGESADHAPRLSSSPAE